MKKMVNYDYFQIEYEDIHHEMEILIQLPLIQLERTFLSLIKKKISFWTFFKISSKNNIFCFFQIYFYIKHTVYIL